MIIRSDAQERGGGGTLVYVSTTINFNSVKITVKNSRICECYTNQNIWKNL